MPNHARTAVWAAICAAVAVAPVFAGPSGGLSGLSNGMAGVQRSMGSGDYAGVSSGLGGLFDAGGGGFSGGETTPVAAGDQRETGAASNAILPAELQRAARSALAGKVPPPDSKGSEAASAKAARGPLAGLLDGAALVYPAVKDTIEIIDKASKNVDAEGARRAREGADKQREAEKKWEGKARNYPQYEDKK